MIGAALAGSGALMQAVTRNPLADSGLLGINAERA
ncbi:iron chelate uptake ABC transporter family permease subunit [Lactiplantibacillus plantarum]|nr:iron chelate uptake ABC transporter family permease subunit [Lactiplantibacillus plantarum]